MEEQKWEGSTTNEEEGGDNVGEKVATSTEMSGDRASTGVTLVGNRWCFCDPETGARLFHNPDTDSWEPEVSAESHTLTEFSRENMQLINGVWVHRDPSTGCVSRWSEESNSWAIVSSAVIDPGQKSEKELEEGEGKANEEEELDELAFQLRQEELERKLAKSAGGQGSTYADPKDGVVYQWDASKKAWFPKIDDDFIAQYQSNYGVGSVSSGEEQTKLQSTVTVSAAVDETSESVRQELLSPEEQTQLAKEKKKQKRRLAQLKQKQQGWFEMDESHNTSVYVSGLPLDITEDEFKELMVKCGLIAMDPITRQLKLKLYKNEDSTMKGDGLCCYIKRESVELALQILDGYKFKDREISAQPARFEMKGEFDPSKKKRKLTAKQKQKFKERQERLFDWRPEKLRGERPKSDSTVILKNVFSIEDFQDAGRLLDLQQEMKSECSKYGEVKKVVVYDNNADGIVAVTFVSPEMADDCVTMMNWRLFHKRQLQATHWDGKTKYRIQESQEDAKNRIEHWEEFLEGGDD